MNSRIPPMGPPLPSFIGQFEPQEILAGNFAQVQLNGVPGIKRGDVLVITTPDDSTAGNLPLSARAIADGVILVIMWNVSGIAQTIGPSPLVFKVVQL